VEPTTRGPARVLLFRRKDVPIMGQTVKSALLVAAVIAVVMLLNNQTGRKLEMLAA
jgi:hypothetical protein